MVPGFREDQTSIRWPISLKIWIEERACGRIKPWNRIQIKFMMLRSLAAARRDLQRAYTLRVQGEARF